MDGSSEHVEVPTVNAGRLPTSDNLGHGSSTQLEEVKALIRSGPESCGSSPGEAPLPERYRRAAQLLQGAFEREEAPGDNSAAGGAGLTATAPQPLLRTSSAPPVQHPCARRIISMDALTQSQEQKSNVDGSVPYPDPTGSMSNMTPRLQPGNSAPSNLRMRWSFSDAKVTPSLPVHLVAPGVPRQVASPQNVVMSSSWTPPGVQPAWRSPRHSYTPTSACSTPQAPPVLMKPGNEMRTSLKGSGTATPPAPNFNRPLGTHGGCGSYAPLAAFPRQPNVRSTVGVAQGLSRPNLAQAKALAVPGAPAAPPAAAPAPVPQTVPCGFVQVTGPPAPHPATSPTARAPVAAVGPVAPPAPATPDAKRAPAEAPHPSLPVQPLYQPIGQDATATRQSLGRRMWRSGTHGKAIGPPSHHEKDDNLTSVCVKLQHKLGKLSTKKTISL